MNPRLSELNCFIRAETRKSFSLRAFLALVILAAAMAVLAHRELRALAGQGAVNGVLFLASGVLAGFGTLGHLALISVAAFLVSFEHSNGTLKEIRLIQPKPYALYVAKTLAVLVCATFFLLVITALAGWCARAGRGHPEPGEIQAVVKSTPLGLLAAAAICLEYLTVLNLCLLGFCVALVCKSPAGATGLAACLFLIADTLKEVLGFENYVFWYHTNRIWGNLAAVADGLHLPWGPTLSRALVIGLVSVCLFLVLFRLLVWRRVEH